MVSEHARVWCSCLLVGFACMCVCVRYALLLSWRLLLCCVPALRRMLHCDIQQPNALADAKRAVCSSVADARAALRRVRRRETARAKAWLLTTEMQHVTIIAFVLSDYNVEPCERYLNMCGRERHWPEPADGELETLVENVFLRTECNLIAALSDATDPLDRNALAIAVQGRTYVESI